MALISIREYGKLRIGELESPSPTVTTAQARRLTNLKQLYGFDVFKWVAEDTISAQQYVGVVQIGALTVEVLPKIDGINDTATRRNLVAMLAVAADLEIREGEVARVATQNHGILEILIRLFCDKLFAQVHRGLIRRYEGHQENIQVLRGRLGVTQQIRLNAGNPERLFCHFDEFQEDNPLNQILKAAARFLLKVSRDLTNQRYLTELLLVLGGVSDISRHNLPLHHFRFDRLSERYRPSFQLAKLFLTNTPPDVSGGKRTELFLVFRNEPFV